jgi:L-amino acid N-acyltransferase YncA
MATPPTLTVRTATADDADATRAIYNLEVETSTVTFDLRSRSSAEQRAWLAERSGALTVLVAEIAGEVAGFASLSQFRERPGYSTSVEDSVYVHRDHQGEGVGRVLLTGVVEAARASGFHAVFARIVAGHEASMALHAGRGFEVVGTEREVGRKFGRWLDVVVMELLLERAPGSGTSSAPGDGLPGPSSVGRRGFEPR